MTNPGPRKSGGRGARRRPKTEERVFFVTGFPGFIGKRLVGALLARHPRAQVLLLVQASELAEARGQVRRLQAALPEARVEILVGDVVDMDLGLSGPEYARLVEEVTDVFHLAASSTPDAAPERLRRVNVVGTRRVLELCRELERLRRLNHMSTAYVCGEREGVIAEDELAMGQRFRNAYEETKYEAEVMVQDARATLPVTVYRPAIVVGDSRTGEIDRFEGPYSLAILLATSPLSVPLPLSEAGSAPLNVVPVDYVVEAVLTLADDPRAEGRTLHLADPNPLSSRRVYELVAERSGKRLPKVTVPARLTDAVLRLPGLERVARRQRQAVGLVNHFALFNQLNTTELLADTGVRCPPLPAYLDRLIGYVEDWYEARREARAELEEDPLDAPAPEPVPPPPGDIGEG